MTHVCLYKSRRAHAYFKVRRGRPHGRPRGRGSVRWRARYIEVFNIEAP